MLSLLDWILDLFRNEDAARAFVAAPEQTMRDAGFAGVSAAQVSTLAATAVPGLVLGGGDPVVGLQRAVANYLAAERQGIDQEQQALAAHSPFRQEQDF